MGINSGNALLDDGPHLTNLIYRDDHWNEDINVAMDIGPFSSLMAIDVPALSGRVNDYGAMISPSVTKALRELSGEEWLLRRKGLCQELSRRSVGLCQKARPSKEMTEKFTGTPESLLTLPI